MIFILLTIYFCFTFFCKMMTFFTVVTSSECSKENRAMLILSLLPDIAAAILGLIVVLFRERIFIGGFY